MLTSDEVKKTVRVLDRMSHLSLFEVNILLTSAGMDSVGVDFDGYSIWDEDAETRKNYLRGCLEQKQYSNEILQNWNESLDALSSLEKENRLAKSESEDLFIFASHLTKDHVQIKKISDVLKWNWNIRLFVAHADIRISEDWSSEIKNALSSCDAGIAFITDRDAFKASDWCDQEIGWMLGRFEDRVLALRFKLNGAYQDPYGPLGGRQAETIAEGESDEQIADKIVDWCMTRESLQNKLCTSLVKAFAKSRNWYQRDDIYKRLKTFHVLNESQVELLLEAMRDNMETWGGEDRTTLERPRILDSLLGFVVSQTGFNSESNRSLLKKVAEEYKFEDSVKKHVDLWPTNSWITSEVTFKGKVIAS